MTSARYGSTPVARITNIRFHTLLVDEVPRIILALAPAVLLAVERAVAPHGDRPEGEGRLIFPAFPSEELWPEAHGEFQHRDLHQPCRPEVPHFVHHDQDRQQRDRYQVQISSATHPFVPAPPFSVFPGGALFFLPAAHGGNPPAPFIPRPPERLPSPAGPPQKHRQSCRPAGRAAFPSPFPPGGKYPRRGSPPAGRRPPPPRWRR